jgi:hypothetical protein
LEDEGGLISVVLRPRVYEASRQALKSPFVVVDGRLQRRGQAISVLARKVMPLEVEGFQEPIRSSRAYRTLLD